MLPEELSDGEESKTSKNTNKEKRNYHAHQSRKRKRSEAQDHSPPSSSSTWSQSFELQSQVNHSDDDENEGGTVQMDQDKKDDLEDKMFRLMNGRPSTSSAAAGNLPTQSKPTQSKPTQSKPQEKKQVISENGERKEISVSVTVPSNPEQSGIHIPGNTGKSKTLQQESPVAEILSSLSSTFKKSEHSVELQDALKSRNKPLPIATVNYPPTGVMGKLLASQNKDETREFPSGAVAISKGGGHRLPPFLRETSTTK